MLQYSDLHAKIDMVLKTGSYDPVFVVDGDLDTLGRMKGAYLLLVQLENDVQVHMPKGLIQFLSSGYYLYAGSAFGGGGIATRVARHFKRDKKVHWRIDQLTIHAETMGAFAIPNGNECDLVDFLQGSGMFGQILPGFGNADCKRCESHLLLPVGGSFQL